MVKINPNSNVQPSNPTSFKKQKDSGTHEILDEKKIKKQAKQIEPPQEVTEDKAKKALEVFNKVFKPSHLDFQLHEDSGKYFVQVIDDQTQEVLIQIPSEEFLQMVAEARDHLGLLIDKRI